MPPMICGGSIIQGSFDTDDAPNLEAVLFLPPGPGRARGELQHVWRPMHRPDRTWEKARIVNDAAVAGTDVEVTGPGALIEARYGLVTGDGGAFGHGHFEVVVPEHGGLAHYWRDNDDLSRPWNRTGVFAPGVIEAGALVENPGNGHLEVVARLGTALYHWWRDGALNWHRSEPPITLAAAGVPALIWSSYGNLEVVVQEGAQLVLYWRDHDAPGLPWKPGGVVAPRAEGPPGFAQGPFGAGEHKNFEVAVPVGDAIEQWWRDNADPAKPWKPGGLVTHGAGPVSALALATSAHDDHLEVLAQECERSIFHYYRYVDDGVRHWNRSSCLRIDEGRFTPDAPPGERPMSVKVNQVTGEFDHQEGQQTQSRTESRYRLRGTDLGASFEHDGKLYFLFGDTHWVDGMLPGTADSIAWTPDTDPWTGLTVYFHRSYLQILWPDIPGPLLELTPWIDRRQGEYDVPQDGFSFNGQMFVFFSTDHFAHRKVMGRSVLTRCTDPGAVFERSEPHSPLAFRYLGELSRRKFINVSVERVDAAAIRRHGLPGGSDGLLIWGSGAYRASNVYLAFLPLDDADVVAGLMGERPFDGHVPKLNFFAGTTPSGGSRWSRDEGEAVPLFFPAAVGELSVRWNPVLKAFLLFYMTGPEDPMGLAVCLRASRRPWGPWSPRRRVLDWWADGMGARGNFASREGWFIHNGAFDGAPGVWGPGAQRDTLGDDGMVGPPSRGGAAYAPYQVPRYTRQDGSTTHLFYVLSTWNPYQVVFMRHPVTTIEFWQLMGGMDFEPPG